MKRVAVVGSGFSSLSAACYLARAGCSVTVFEKNETIGGRARRLTKIGFSFDMGPTWYWMPDVYENFFADFGKSTTDYYQLTKLEPAYQIYYGKSDALVISGNLDEIYETFENEEPGAGGSQRFLETAAYNYNVAMKKVIEKQGNRFGNW
jgi:phytoene desaturase